MRRSELADEMEREAAHDPEAWADRAAPACGQPDCTARTCPVMRGADPPEHRGHLPCHLRRVAYLSRGRSQGVTIMCDQWGNDGLRIEAPNPEVPALSVARYVDCPRWLPYPMTMRQARWALEDMTARVYRDLLEEVPSS